MERVISRLAAAVGRVFGFVAKRWDSLILIVCVCVFAVQAGTYAVTIQRRVFPDEDYHYAIAQLYVDDLSIADDSPETYWLGTLEGRPFLYHLVMGLWERMNITGIDSLVWMRMGNVALGVMTVLVTYTLSRILFKRKIVQILPAIILANVTMFVFLSGAVSYDNLANLLAAVSVLGFVMSVQKDSFSWLLVMLVSLSIGILVKTTILPLAGIMVVVWILLKMRDLRSVVWGGLSQSVKQKRPVPLFMLFLLGLSAGYGLWMYGNNIATYRSLTPSCEQILGHENCMKSRLYRRNYKNRELDPDGEMQDPVEYIWTWTKIMAPQIAGVSGHETRWMTRDGMLLYASAGIIVAVLFLVNIRNTPSMQWSFLAISLAYILILMYYQNYRTYANTGIEYLAVQGRYVFPVITPALLLVSYALSTLRKTYVVTAFAAFVISVFVWGNWSTMSGIYFKDDVSDRFLAMVDIDLRMNPGVQWGFSQRRIFEGYESQENFS